jgi:hypothetical protein
MIRSTALSASIGSLHVRRRQIRGAAFSRETGPTAGEAQRRALLAAAQAFQLLRRLFLSRFSLCNRQPAHASRRREAAAEHTARRGGRCFDEGNHFTIFSENVKELSPALVG